MFEEALSERPINSTPNAYDRVIVIKNVNLSLGAKVQRLRIGLLLAELQGSFRLTTKSRWQYILKQRTMDSSDSGSAVAAAVGSSTFPVLEESAVSLSGEVIDAWSIRARKPQVPLANFIADDFTPSLDRRADL